MLSKVRELFDLILDVILIAIVLKILPALLLLTELTNDIADRF